MFGSKLGAISLVMPLGGAQPGRNAIEVLTFDARGLRGGTATPPLLSVSVPALLESTASCLSAVPASPPARTFGPPPTASAHHSTTPVLHSAHSTTPSPPPPLKEIPPCVAQAPTGAPTSEVLKEIPPCVAQAPTGTPASEVLKEIPPCVTAHPHHSITPPLHPPSATCPDVLVGVNQPHHSHPCESVANAVGN